MNCEVCGTELPYGAMFCGECGRAVGSRAPQPFFGQARSATIAPPLAGPVVHPDSGMPGVPPAYRAQPGDTNIIEPLDPDLVDSHGFGGPAAAAAIAPDSVEPEIAVDESENAAEIDDDAVYGDGYASGEIPLGDVEQDLDPATIADDLEEDAAASEVAPEPELEPEPEPEPEPEASSVEPEPPHPLVEPGRASERAVPSTPVTASPVTSPTTPTPPPAASRPDPFPWGESLVADPLSDDLEQTLIVQRRDQGERFILQFSTGESVTVFGTGLLGRNPTPQPGEYFDQLVAISDHGKSVSKTHLEFGQEAGAFWVSDRFSGNGSIVREPESAPKRLTAGKRYRIVRGTRVDIGEQFFIVS